MAKMTIDEIAAMFGGEIPMEAFQFLFVTAPPDMTLREVRNELEKMAERGRSKAIERRGQMSDEEWRDHFLPAYYPKRTEGLTDDLRRMGAEALTGTLRPAVEAGLAAVAAYRATLK